MSELGMRLKAAREEKGYTLEELQTVTKIQKRYLTAIEDGDFSRMPGDFYARAFVKRYADAVGLNSEMVFEEHREELPQPKREPAELPPRVNRTKPKMIRKKSKFASLIPTLVVVIFILAVGYAFWYFNQGEEGSTGIPREEQQSDANVDLPDTDIDDEGDEGEASVDDEEPESEPEPEPEPEPELEQTLEFERAEGENSYYTLANTDSFNVRLEFSGQSWIRIRDVDNNNLHEGTYSNGDEIEYDFSDQEQIIIRVGSIPVTEIYLNDEVLEYENNNNVQNIIIVFETMND